MWPWGLCNPMDCRPPGFSFHGILQASILERVAVPFSHGSSGPRDQTHISYISCIGRQILYHFCAWEVLFLHLKNITIYWEPALCQTFLIPKQTSALNFTMILGGKYSYLTWPGSGWAHRSQGHYCMGYFLLYKIVGKIRLQMWCKRVFIGFVIATTDSSSWRRNIYLVVETEATLVSTLQFPKLRLISFVWRGDCAGDSPPLCLVSRVWHSEKSKEWGEQL